MSHSWALVPFCRARTRALTLAAAVAAMSSGAALLAVAAGAQPGPGVAGVVYVDVDSSGTRDPGEVGLAGVAVAAFGRDHAFVGSTTTDEDGRWSLAVDRAVRIEVDPDSGEAEGWGVESTAWGRPAVAEAAVGDLDHDVALMDVGRFCGDDPQLVVSCFFGSLAAGDSPAVRIIDAAAGTTEVADRRLDTDPQRWPEATVAGNLGDVGAVSGLATEPGSGSIYAAAHAKRFAPLGPLGVNGIYRATPEGEVVPFYASLSPAAPDRTLANGDPWSDPWGVWQVGWIGWGDIDVVGGRLYGVNLGDRQLYIWDLAADGSAAGAPRTVPIPLQGPTALSDRPYGLGSWRGTVYVGGVDTGDRPGAPVAPSAWVQRFDPETMTFPDAGATPAATFRLDGVRGCVYRVNLGCGLLDLRVGWRRWGSAPTESTKYDVNLSHRYDFQYNPQPIVADLEFDDDGDLIVGMRDRWGDLLARMVDVGTVPNPWFGSLGPRFTRFLDGYAFGDVLRLDAVGDGWVLEHNGASGGVTGSSHSGAGPGGGEFYDADHALVDTDLYDGLGRALQGHDETATGGLALVPGSDEVAVASYDVFGVFDTLGVRWLGNDGTDVPSGRAASVERANRAAIIQQDPQGSRSPSPFGKNNGLGDIEVLCGQAPRIIGDRVWFDSDGNGIQDPDGDGPAEPGLGDVTLQLLDETGTIIATTRTDEDGRYRFIVEQGHDYQVVIPATEFVEGRLAGTTLSPSDAPDRGGADSDARADEGRAVVSATAPPAGGAALHYDIGVVPVPRPPGPPVTTVPPRIELPTTTVVPTTTIPLDGGRTWRSRPLAGPPPTSSFLAATGTTVVGLFSLALGLMLFGLALLGIPSVRGRDRRDRHVDGG